MGPTTSARQPYISAANELSRQAPTGSSTDGKRRPTEAPMTHAGEFSTPDRLESPIATFLLYFRLMTTAQTTRKDTTHTTSNELI